MNPAASTIAIAAPVITSGLTYASPPELTVQSGLSHTHEKASQMIVRPKNQMELAKNLKYIFDHDLVQQDDFYTETSLRDSFGLDAIRRNDEATADGDENISVVSSRFSSIFPQPKAPGSRDFVPGANLTGGRRLSKYR